MAEPFVRVITMQYTEEVVYDADGYEVARWQNEDGSAYDETVRDLTDEEKEDYL